MSSCETQSSITRRGNYRAESMDKPRLRGVYSDQRLSFSSVGKVQRGTEAKVANRTREIRPSGMKTGAHGNVSQG